LQPPSRENRGEISFAAPRRLRFATGRNMTAEELSRSAANDPAPPAGASPAAQALWYARTGKWDAAHDLCQDIPGNAGSWIHAWLHREEGDLGNAGYWYSRAGKPMPPKHLTLEQEWLAIASELVG
jgi:hypothetical protein